MKKIAAIVLCLLSMQAFAGLFSDDEARQQIGELRAQVQASDARVANVEAASNRILELLNQINKLQDEIAQLRGKIEVMQFNQEESVKRQRDLFLDLDARLRVFESKELAAEQARQAQVAAAEKAAQQAAAEQQQVNEAAALIKTGQNKEGIAALAKFIAANPESVALTEANYWTAVAYAANKDYKAAKNTFNAIVKDAPKDPRAPDALLGMASVAQSQKDTALSRKYLAMILERYPDSEAAKTAKKALAVSK